MFGFDPWSQTRQQFADQFEPDGENFLYRRWQKGPPVPVTAAERHEFLDQFNRRLRYINWGTIIALILFTATIIWWTVESGTDLPETPLYVGIGVIVAGSVGYTMWGWTAPARQLSRRTAIGSERQRGELRRLMIKKKSYGQLAGTAVVGLGASLTLAGSNGWSSMWGKVWLLLAAVIVVAAAIQAFLKWRYEQQDRDAAP